MKRKPIIVLLDIESDHRSGVTCYWFRYNGKRYCIADNDIDYLFLDYEGVPINPIEGKHVEIYRKLLAIVRKEQRVEL